jgi:hypothetical protein
MYSGLAVFGIGFGAGLVSLLSEPVRRRWRLFFGPYPLLLIYVWVSRIGLVKDRAQTLGFLEKLRKAGVKEELDPHLGNCAIRITTSLTLTQGGNEQVCTYDPTRRSRTFSDQAGYYGNLHVGRKVLKFIREL